MRPYVLKTRLNKFLKKDDLYTTFFDSNKIVFVHIPKCAGTSVSYALYGSDTWHYSAKELKFINPQKFSNYYKFSIVREPIERIISTYSYSKEYIKNNPNTSIAFIQNYENVDAFIQDFINRDNIKRHYFFWRQTDYLCNNRSKLLVDKFIKMEELDEGISQLNKLLCVSLSVKKMNQSKSKEIKISEESKKIIHEVYAEDYVKFGYEKL